jgi:uncharacterized metal-binding protein
MLVVSIWFRGCCGICGINHLNSRFMHILMEICNDIGKAKLLENDI